MRIKPLIVAALLALLGCDETVRDVEAFSKPPTVETGNSSEKDGCEIKGSGAYNPCLNGSSQNADALFKVEVTAATCQDNAAYADVLFERTFESVTRPGSKKYSEAENREIVRTVRQDIETECAALGYPQENEQSAPPPETSSLQPKAVSSSAGGQSCANPFGGSAAPSGQYICSNQGELQACQCSGGGCNLIPTGSFLCTSPGAVIR